MSRILRSLGIPAAAILAAMPAVVHAADDAATTRPPAFASPAASEVGTGVSGARGIYRLDAAVPLNRPWGLSLATRYSLASDLLAPGDRNFQEAMRITASMAATPHLDLVAAHTFVFNQNRAFSPPELLAMDESITAKLSFMPRPWLGAGATLSAAVSPRAVVPGLNSSGFAITALGLATLRPIPSLTLTVNGGYVIDEYEPAAATETPAHRYLISGASRFVAGVGGELRIRVADAVRIGAFAEGTASFAQSDHAQRLTLGGRWLASERVEVVVGTELRLTGAPDTTDRLAVPPWEAFAMVAVHTAVAPETTGACRGPDDCVAGTQCEQGVCTVLREVEVARAVDGAMPLVILRGRVLDTSGKAIPNARVQISGAEMSALAVDPDTGAFQTAPLPLDPANLTLLVEARNYVPVTQQVTGVDQAVMVTLAREVGTEEDVGQVTGRLYDRKSGAPIRGRLFILALRKVVPTDATGIFEVAAASGHYDVLVSARGYETLRTALVIRRAETIAQDFALTRRGH